MESDNDLLKSGIRSLLISSKCKCGWATPLNRLLICDWTTEELMIAVKVKGAISMGRNNAMPS